MPSSPEATAGREGKPGHDNTEGVPTSLKMVLIWSDSEEPWGAGGARL
jgi:hypothetical protein